MQKQSQPCLETTGRRRVFQTLLGAGHGQRHRPRENADSAGRRPRHRTRAHAACYLSHRQRRDRQSGRHPQPDRRRYHPVIELDFVRASLVRRYRITGIDWASYPILRFASVPDSIEVHIIERPGEPFLGTGEAAQGPTVAAIRNAILNATGAKLYDLPFTRDRVRAATAA
jgi:hypothetical protein